MAAIVYKHHNAKTVPAKVVGKGNTKYHINGLGKITYAEIYTGKKLFKIQQFYPSSNINTANKHIKYSFDINSDKTIKHAVKLD
ncbi:hypothetical protein [Neobacillus kokaensis]|uniref:Uncharacterized protein n=1 Tax=Neobacillus kokaensis TaxID=2759023 RepID=A0ABQ3N4I1_9BACI|nr:hypothetical protein [Neobacillus kokaensis]GHH97435.1 hypothetical protein AM1BK_09780 [Neobacillus kokaensis]